MPHPTAVVINDLAQSIRDTKRRVLRQGAPGRARQILAKCVLFRRVEGLRIPGVIRPRGLPRIRSDSARTSQDNERKNIELKRCGIAAKNVNLRKVNTIMTASVCTH
jgi:hypothetical protein